MKRYAEAWVKERKERGIRSARADESRLKLHALPQLGALRLDAVPPQHVRDLVRELRKTGKLAARSILAVFGTLHTLFADAEIEARC